MKSVHKLLLFVELVLYIIYFIACIASISCVNNHFVHKRVHNYYSMRILAYAHKMQAKWHYLMLEVSHRTGICNAIYSVSVHYTDSV